MLQVAIQHGIKVMTASWITSMHEQYLRGEIVDLDFYTILYAFPPLHGLDVAFTAVPLQPELIRKDLIQSISSAGAAFSAHFKDTVTHLLVGSELDQSTVWSNPKVMKAQEFNARKSRMDLNGANGSVSVVWSEWLEDSLKMGGALDEQKYSIRNPRPDPMRVVAPISCSFILLDSYM